MIKKLMFNEYDSSIRSTGSERNYTFDLVRGYAVIFMIAVHVLGVYSTVDVYSSGFGYIVDFLGSPPAAPVFMFTMGVFFILSSKTESLKAGVMRGVKLFALSYVFSFIRSDVLLILESIYTGSFEHLQQSMVTLIEVDILQFAGLAYILMSLIREYVKKPIGWISAAVVIMFASPFLWGITSGIAPIDWMLNYLWGSGAETYFPVFGWLFYPLMGMAFGVIYKASHNKSELFQKILEPSILMIAIGSIVSLTDIDFHVGDYFRSGPGASLWILGFIGIWLWFNDKYLAGFANRTDDLYKKILEFICYMGRATTKIYLIHWILLTWSAALIGYETQGYLGTLVMMIFFTLVTYWMSKKVKYAV